MDQVEVHKALGGKRTEFRLALQIIQRGGHGDLTRHFDGMGIARRGSLNVLVSVVRSDRFLFYLDQEIRRRLWRGVRTSVKSEGDVCEEAVRLRDDEAMQRSGVSQRGMTRRFAGSFRYRERVYFHAASRQPAAYGGCAALVNCRAKIAATTRRLLPRPTEQPKRKEFLWLS